MFNNYILTPFIKAVDLYGTANAFCINDNFYTYNDFARSISKIRLALRKYSNKYPIVGIVANDDLETYAAIFALWMEGCAYVPLHPKQPMDRSMEIINQAGISLLIDSDIDTKYKDISLINSSNLSFNTIDLKPKPISDDELAYILFTSGSTGKPKGVQITRKNLSSFMKSFWETGFIIRENDRCLQCFDLTFDVSVQSFLVPLTRGACTYTIPHNQIKYSYVYGLLEDHQLTFSVMTPSMIRYLKPYFNEISNPVMRYNIVTAEASPTDLISEWSKCIPNAEIFNFYGPTEATIYCTYYRFNRIESNKHVNGMMSIGRPLWGVEAIIIDESHNLLSNNKKGQLCICSEQVTPGYLKDPLKNEESFFEINFKGKPARFYKTGDSCIFDDEGDILIYGRQDHQIKIDGYRIELGEIEYHARNFLKGQNVIANAFTNAIGNTEILLFIEGIFDNEKDLSDYLINKLPNYMVPKKYLSIEKFPINTSGKVDRISLMYYLK